MKKDVIYIDIEDDITAIIGKVKAASAKIVALVPPKRTGVLQSAVNIKLLQRGASEVDKRIVLITSDHLLTSLAAGLKMPVAKNLQSRPEIPIIPALQIDDTDIINGEELPVGDIAAAASGSGVLESQATSTADEISNHIDLTGLGTEAPVAVAAAQPSQQPTSKQPLTKFAGKSKVPNFNTFLKRLFLIGIAVFILGGFLFWALVIAPTATVIINAKTSSVNIDRTLSLVPSLSSSDTSKLQLKPMVKQLKKSATATFTATGTKDIGTKATGSMTIRNCDYASGFTLPAGTTFTAASGQVFSSTQAVSVPQFNGPASACTLGGANSGQATVPVQANDIGTDYNVAAQNYTFQQTGNVDAVGSAMTGGTKNTVTVVSQSDIDAATKKLTPPDANAAKQELSKEFGNDQLVIAESFTSASDSPVVSPDLGQQATQSTITVQTTFTLVSVARSDMTQLLTDALKASLNGQSNQSIFNNGENNVEFQAFQALSDGTYTARMTTTGYIGTTIDTKQLAKMIAGKQYGAIQQMTNAIPGVDKVTINLSPFWVASAPSNPDKITIRFTVVNGAQ